MKNPTNTKASAGHLTQNSETNSNRVTVKNAVLNALKSGVRLTQHDATFLYGTSRLGAVIYDLRKEGYDIRTDSVEVDAAKGKPTAHNARIAVYSMVGGEK
jgi:hypothetical protein